MSDNTAKSRSPHKHKRKPTFQTLNTVQGIQAVLVTCDTGVESACFKQCAQWLYELHAQLYGTQDSTVTQPSNAANVADSIQAELAALQHADKHGHNAAVSGSEKLFVRIPVKMRGNVLLGISDPSVSALQLCTAAVQHIHNTRTLPVRYAIRMTPLQRTCYSTLDGVVKCAQHILPEQLHCIAQQHTASTYAIDFNRRGSNANLQRNDCITALAALMPPQYTVNLSQPDVVLRVDSIERVSGLCVYYNDKQLHAFNIRMLYETLTGLKIDTAADKHSTELYDQNDDMNDVT